MYFIISLCYKTAVPGVYIMVSISKEISAPAVLILSVISDSASLWAGAQQAPLSMGILQARRQQWVAMPSSRGFSHPRD